MMGNRAVDFLGPRAIRKLLRGMGEPRIRVVLWDGQGLGASEVDAEGTVRIADRGALLRLLYDPELQFGELYSEGLLTVEGDLIGVLAAAYAADPGVGAARKLLPRFLLERATRNDLNAARDNAHHHYDVGNDFYALWLDERMVYTCAYFPTPDAGLEEAQVAKLDHVCRKVALQPGDRVVEAGSGWGALALHMARYYGARVRAFNVSHEQVVYAREQAEKQGLADRVEFVEDDYRNISGRWDAFVSVGMLEHVGTRHYEELGRVIDRSLGPDGRGLIHTIGRSRPMPLQRWIAKRVFPNAHPPTLRQLMDVLEPSDLVTLDVENLRLHYAMTLRHWLGRLEREMPRAIELVGPELARAWHLYLAGAIAAFETGGLQLFQLVFARADCNRIPWTRAYLYSGESARFGAPAESSDGPL